MSLKRMMLLLLLLLMPLPPLQWRRKNRAADEDGGFFLTGEFLTAFEAREETTKLAGRKKIDWKDERE